jgi:predicted dehydrogenase
VFSTIESNSFDGYYEALFGTRGTLIFRRETEALLFDEGEGAKRTALEVGAAGPGAMSEASESRAADAMGGGPGSAQSVRQAVRPYNLEVSEFCSAIRAGTPLRCGPERALGSAAACLAAREAVESKSRVSLDA